MLKQEHRGPSAKNHAAFETSVRTVALVTKWKARARAKKEKASAKERFRRLANIVRWCVSLSQTSYKSLESQKAKLMSVTQKSEELVEHALDTKDLVFNPAQFKANRQASISNETRRILQKSGEDRSHAELKYLGLSLRNLPAFAAYPFHMQKRFCKVGWYETYDTRRTIIRQGHPPLAFYFILAGTVVVTVHEPTENLTRTMCFLHRGMEFGELALVTRTRRKGTVISKTPVELLVISVRDFQDIFVSGGIRSLMDPEQANFIRSLHIMRGWPFEKLVANPSECMFHYYSPGHVVVRDSRHSDWIYIVKSGSLSVLKKLKEVKPTRPENEAFYKRKVKKRKRGLQPWQPPPDEVRQMFNSNYELKSKLEQTLPGVSNPSDRLGILDYDRIVQDYTSRLKPRKSTTVVQQPILFPAQDSRPSLDTMETMSEPEHPKERLRLPKISRSAKGVYIATPARGNAEDSSHTDGRIQSKPSLSDSQSLPPVTASRKHSEEVVPEGRQDVTSFLDPKRQSVSHTPADTNPVFILIQVLERGQYFGLRESLFADQPSTSLVSNGAECMMLSKNFFMQHLPERALRKLKQLEVPLPLDAELQRRLQERVNWRAHCAQTYHSLVTDKADRTRRRRQYPAQTIGSYDFRAGPL